MKYKTCLILSLLVIGVLVCSNTWASTYMITTKYPKWSILDYNKSYQGDSLMCWAYSMANLIDGSGVWGNKDFPNVNYTEIDASQHIVAHYANEQGSPRAAWQWWVDGENHQAGGTPAEIGDGGGFWPDIVSGDYDAYTLDLELVIPGIRIMLQTGYGVALGIEQASTGAYHWLNAWGYEYILIPGEDHPAVTGLHITDNEGGGGPTLDLWNVRYITNPVNSGDTEKRWYITDQSGAQDWYVSQAVGLRAPELPPGAMQMMLLMFGSAFTWVKMRMR